MFGLCKMFRVCSQVQVFPLSFCATCPLNNDNMVTFIITEKGIYTCLVPQPFEIKKMYIVFVLRPFHTILGTANILSGSGLKQYPSISTINYYVLS